MFDVPRKRLSCADCGKRILNAPYDNIDYHRQSFSVNDGTVAFASFCGECVTKEWSLSRLAAFNAQCQYGWRHHVNPAWSPDGVVITGPQGTPQTWEEVI